MLLFLTPALPVCLCLFVLPRVNSTYALTSMCVHTSTGAVSLLYLVAYLCASLHLESPKVFWRWCLRSYSQCQCKCKCHRISTSRNGSNAHFSFFFFAFVLLLLVAFCFLLFTLCLIPFCSFQMASNSWWRPSTTTSAQRSAARSKRWLKGI